MFLCIPTRILWCSNSYIYMIDAEMQLTSYVMYEDVDNNNNDAVLAGNVPYVCAKYYKTLGIRPSASCWLDRVHKCRVRLFLDTRVILFSKKSDATTKTYYYIIDRNRRLNISEIPRRDYRTKSKTKSPYRIFVLGRSRRQTLIESRSFESTRPEKYDDDFYQCHDNILCNYDFNNLRML